MSYSYYQDTAPGWGTTQFQFGAPPRPSFQPQPSWGGMDFYNAHAIQPDPRYFNHAWDRARNYGVRGEGGVGKHEARHWHRRAYGGLGQLNQMLPSEIGHAAAYEAYRTWIHNSSIYEPLSGDFERQREGLIGFAVAESSRLLQYAGRLADVYSREEASDAAACTASIIFDQKMEREMEGRGRRASFSGSYAGSVGSIDPYAYDDGYGSYGRRRRHSSSSRTRPMFVPGSPSMNQYGTPSTMPVQIPGQGMPMPYTNQPGSYGSYGSYGGVNSIAMPGSYGSYGAGMPGQVMMVPSKSRKHRHRSRSRRNSAVDIMTVPSYAGSMGSVGSYRY